MRLSDFYYKLPPELIARYPLEKRSASRLLFLSETGEIKHGYFADLLDYVGAQDLIVFNQSKVIPARLYGNKETGGRVEILIERLLENQQCLVHLRASKPPAIGSYLTFAEGLQLKVLGRENNLYILQAETTVPLLELIERIGEIPLPPYLQRKAEDLDKERYQTVYAQDKGSVAAPTAGLHFDQPLLNELQQRGVEFAFLTLHVGAGTFLPVRSEQLTEHHMHPEYIEVSSQLSEKVKQTKARGGRVIAVGTTSARALEAAAQQGEICAYRGDTALFIYPGFEFKCVDLLLTNFHLPESTLLMLVCAFGGYEKVMAAYQEAVARHYRFYSYGDAMIIAPGKDNKVLPLG